MNKEKETYEQKWDRQQGKRQEDESKIREEAQRAKDQKIRITIHMKKGLKRKGVFVDELGDDGSIWGGYLICRDRDATEKIYFSDIQSIDS